MKILIVSQYFWPENFKINDIALGLKERGHEVVVLTGIPNYPKGEFFEGYSSSSPDEYWNGIKIYRSKLIPRKKGGVNLLINYLSFVFAAKKKLREIPGPFNRIFVYEPSPITVGLPAITASKKFRAPYYFWVQDLWPESLTAAGGITNPFILKVFDKITRTIYRKAEKVLVQSEGFKDYIRKQGVPNEKIIFYPNSTESFYRIKECTQKYSNLVGDGFKIIFAGNLGEAQSLDTLLRAAEIVKDNGVDAHWIFLGDGRQRGALEKLIVEKKLSDTVKVLGSFPSEEMPDFFACSDVLIASLKKSRAFELTIPSKIQSYMACGKALLVSLDGEGAKIVNAAKCGFSSPSEDAETLAQNVIKLKSLPAKELQEMGENARRYFEENFEREFLLDRLLEILKQ